MKTIIHYVTDTGENKTLTVDGAIDKKTAYNFLPGYADFVVAVDQYN